MKSSLLYTVLPALLLTACDTTRTEADLHEPVDYVNPYIGNISHLLVPTFPNVHLPNSMLRMVPERGDFTSDRLNGLPVIVTNHREKSAFNLSLVQGDSAAFAPVTAYSYDNEDLKPYRYSVFLDEAGIYVDFAPAPQSAVYKLKMKDHGPSYLTLNSREGTLKTSGNAIKGYQDLDNGVRIYLYMESEQKPTGRDISSRPTRREDTMPAWPCATMTM